MSDYASSLPTRTEAPGDIQVKVSDGTTPTQFLAVDATGKVYSKLNDGAGNDITSQVNGAQRALDVGINVAGVQVDPRQVRTLTAADVVTVVATDLDIRNLVFATDKVDVSNSVVALDAGTLAALESITVQNGAGASAVNVQDGGNSLTVDAVDLDIRDLTAASDSVKVHLNDASGNPFTAINPLPVTVTLDNAGNEINDHKQASAVAANATDNHDYTVTAATTLILTQIEASASGKAKMVVSVETGVATNVFTQKFVQFNSTAETNMSIKLASPLKVLAGVRVRVAITNRDNQAQDLYSTISGQEVS